jgi:hypothetical protein
MNCAPGVKFDFTCFSKDSLIKIAKSYNKLCSKDDGTKNGGAHQCLKIKTNASKHEIYEQLKKIVHDKCRDDNCCQDDNCWIHLNFVKQLKDIEIDFFTFKPMKLKTDYTLFDTNKINEILYQYERFVPGFKFLGAQPSDISSLIHYNYTELKNDYNKVGIVFNNDTHSKSGSHWVAVFIDNKKKKVEFFDSLGQVPNKYMLDFLKHFKDYTFRHNEKQHQKNSSVQCGVYVCYFIIQKLKGKTFDQINSKIITESKIKDYRKTLFIN